MEDFGLGIVDYERMEKEKENGQHKKGVTSVKDGNEHQA